MPFGEVEERELDFAMEDFTLGGGFDTTGFGEKGLSGSLGAKGYKIEGGKSRGEEEITHELWLDGKARGMWKTKGVVSTTPTEQGSITRKTEDVHNTLSIAKMADKDSSQKHNKEETSAEAAGRKGERQEIEHRENGEEDEPDDAGSKEATERIRRPNNRNGEIKREKGEEEETTVGEAGEIAKKGGFLGKK